MSWSSNISCVYQLEQARTEEVEVLIALESKVKPQDIQRLETNVKCPGLQTKSLTVTPTPHGLLHLSPPLSSTTSPSTFFVMQM